MAHHHHHNLLMSWARHTNVKPSTLVKISGSSDLKRYENCDMFCRDVIIDNVSVDVCKSNAWKRPRFFNTRTIIYEDCDPRVSSVFLNHHVFPDVMFCRHKILVASKLSDLAKRYIKKELYSRAKIQMFMHEEYYVQNRCTQNDPFTMLSESNYAALRSELLNIKK